MVDNKKGRLQKYNYPTNINGTISPIYDRWRGMYKRCSNPTGIKNQSYMDCHVCEEWHDFNKFAEWMEDNYYEIPGETMCLDKDVLVKNNRVYSSETCIIIPGTINNMFASSGFYSDLPRGVNATASGRYIARISMFDKVVNLGVFDDPVTAFRFYKYHKECYILQMANKYKQFIPDRVYDTLINYVVDINDK